MNRPEESAAVPLDGGFSAVPDGLGPVRYSLQVPALALPDYARLQTVFLCGTAARSGWRRHLTGLIGSVLVGSLAGYLVVTWDISAEFWIASARRGWMLSLEDFEAVLAVLCVVLATTLALGVLQALRQRQRLRALHAAGGALLGAHTLLLAERGILWCNESRTLFVPWSRLTGAVRQGEMLFLLADRISAFWLPDALVATHPDREGLEIFLRGHAAFP